MKKLLYTFLCLAWFFTPGQARPSGFPGPGLPTTFRTENVSDSLPPTVVCLNGLNVNIMPTAMITLWAPDLLSYAEDDVTPQDQLKFAIRKYGAGTGFPVDANGQPAASVTFTCADLGTQIIELWVQDAAGNTDFCETYVIVQDPLSICEPGSAVNICVFESCFHLPVAGVEVELNGFSGPIPPPNGSSVLSTDTTGCTILSGIPLSANLTVTPSKDDDPRTGLNTLDLIKMTRHILGIEALGSPFQIIAADVNKSNSVTTFDVVELRKLLLGIYAELPNNTSWRFLDQSFAFDNPVNPFWDVPFAEAISLADVSQNDSLEFVGIRIGDVDCSAVQDLTVKLPPAVLKLPKLTLDAGETATVPVYLAESADWLGFQLALQADPAMLEIEDLVPGGAVPSLSSFNFGFLPGLTTASWNHGWPQAVQAGVPLFVLQVKALQPLQLQDVFTLDTAFLRPEAYVGVDTLRPLVLGFDVVSGAPESPADALLVFPPQPNPVTGDAARIFLPVQLPEAAEVRLELFDQTGRILFSETEKRPAGWHPLELPARVFQPAGCYAWRLVVSGKAFSGRIIRQ